MSTNKLKPVPFTGGWSGGKKLPQVFGLFVVGVIKATKRVVNTSPKSDYMGTHLQKY